MVFPKDFEISNARQWVKDDDESEASDSPKSSAQRVSKPNPSGELFSVSHGQPASTQQGLLIDHVDSSGGNGNAVFIQTGSTTSLPRSQSRPACTASSEPQGSRNEREMYTRATAHQSDLRPSPSPQPRDSNIASQRQVNHRTPFASRLEKPGKADWARPEGLVSTRLRSELKEKEAKAINEQKYLKEPGIHEIFPSVGYYLWPSKTDTAFDLLGSDLEDLNSVKITFSVYINWDHDTRCLRIRSPYASSFEHSIIDIIKSIRLAIENAKARAMIATPLYIVVPPSTATWGAEVMPILSKNVGNKSRNQPVILGLKLSSSRSKDVEKWKIDRSTKLRENTVRFQAHLIRNVTALSPLTCWMRMRVSFGKLKIKKYQKAFLNKNYSVKEFESMIQDPQAIGEFNKQIDAVVARKAMARFAEDVNFSPAEPHITRTQEIEAKHTEVIFVTSPTGQNLRIEADLDLVSTSETDEYQIGTTKLFYDNQRNKRVEVTTVDIESHFDWNIEIITDNSLQHTPTALQALIDSSISGASRRRYDNLGLSYPVVFPQASYDIQVRRVVIKSVLKYMLNPVGYVVEVSVYREWPNHNTSAEPQISCGFTVCHPHWDGFMESTQGTTSERKWKGQLENFFPLDNITGGNGFVDFLDRVRQIQEVLCAAAVGP